jgi:cardiolipin synthase
MPRGRTRRGRPFLLGHQVDVLVDGGPFYRSLLADIAAARRFVFVETYILRSDETGWRVARALAERAHAGVEVALCYDAYGSDGLSAEFLQLLDEAGVLRLPFRPLSFWKWSWPWSRRNHRKILLVDGQTATVGGMNIANEYAAEEQGGKGWRDTSVRIQGPAVAQVERMFRHLWRREGGPALRTERGEPPAASGGLLVRFFANFARGERAMIRRAYLVAITGAQRSVRITNAYFFPDRALRRALVQAARRGVSVELIVAGKSDVKPAVYAARSLYARFLKAGVKIYEWHERVLHAKTAVVDGEWSTIGSSNLDPFSSFVNLEINAGIFSRRIGDVMVAQFEADRARCVPVEAEAWRHRALTERLLELMFRWVTKRY